MVLKSAPYYWVVCDECGESAMEGSEYSAMADGGQALDSAVDAGWSISPDGTKHRCEEHNRFCEKCGEDAGKDSGDRDEMCQTCFDADAILGAVQ